MQTRPHHQHESPADNNHSVRTGKNAAALTRSITFLLLALITAIFAPGGTTSESAGHFMRAATVGFPGVAATVFATFRNQRNHP